GMRLHDIVPQACVGESGLSEMLYPFHPARGEIGSRTQAGPLLEHLVGDVAHLEGEARRVLLPAADGEDFAADLPDMRSAPLNDACGRGKRSAKFVKLLVGQFAITPRSISHPRAQS